MMAAHTDDRATVTLAQSNLLPLNQEPKSGGDRYAVLPSFRTGLLLALLRPMTSLV